METKGYFQTQVTYRGEALQVWRRDMTRIDKQTPKTIVYIYPTKDDAHDGTEEGATGFLFAVPSRVDSSKAHIHVITNAHVAFNDSMKNPILRINTANDTFDIVETAQNDWHRHPDGDDVALYVLDVNPNYEYSYFHEQHIPTDEFMEEQNVGIGDDVILVGRFKSAGGKSINRPTARFGNIAQMPSKEGLLNQFTKLEQESYIVELRSISGYSGSPVILSIPPFSKRWIKQEADPLSQATFQRLLGVHWGHIPIHETLVDEDGMPLKERIKKSSAMAGVVPSYKLMELINHRDVVAIREAFDRQWEQDIATAPIVLDNATDNAHPSSDFSSLDMDNALRTAFKPDTEDETSDEGKSET